MKAKNLLKLVMIPIIVGSLNGKIQAQDSTSVQKPKTISIDGWLQATKGINKGNNLRLYPQLKIKNFNTFSLIDINNFYNFSKNDLYHEKLKINLGKNLHLKPMLTAHTNPSETKLTADANLTYAKGKYFGYFEIDVNPLDVEQPEFYTYHDIGTKLGNLGIFATGKIRDIKNTYSEIQFTGKQIKKSGISPYIRANVQNGQKPTYQAGLSFKPRDFVNRLKRDKKQK